MNDIHSPYWPNNKYYFITTSTFLHFPYFKFDDQKQIVLARLKEIEKKFKIEIKAYSIAINHFHYLSSLDDGRMYSKLKQLINGGISREYNKRFSKRYSEMWQSTRAFVINNEEDYWRVTGYIIGNLLKHKEVNTFRELNNNTFSSYINFINEYDEEVAKNLVYKVIDVDEDREGNVDIAKLQKKDINNIMIGTQVPRPSTKVG